jgi:expansin (peptidoglycan-binding protein)
VTGSAGAPSTGGAGSGGGGAGSRSCAPEPKRDGEATFYTFADGTGNCGFDATPSDLLVGAMNHTDYANAAACGACAHLVGPSGEVTVRIVDQCPECPKGNIDLSPQAFDHIAQRAQGRVTISWQYVACAVQGPLRYRFKEGSSQYWTAVQVRNHTNAIAKFEYQKAGAFVEVARESYNYFVEASGMGPGPYTFRVTDVYGGQVTDTGIALRVAAEVAGKSQLAACSK